MVVAALLDLDEVVAPAQGTELAAGAGELRADHRQFVLLPGRAQVGHQWEGLRTVVVLEPHRHRAAQVAEDGAQLLNRHFVEAGAHRLHAAADVHAHAVGDDRAHRGQHPADGHAVAHVGIGHDGDVVEGAVQVGQVAGLVHGLVVQLVEPEEDGNFFGVDHTVHGALHWVGISGGGEGPACAKR